jgi:hypothetical protein
MGERVWRRSWGPSFAEGESPACVYASFCSCRRALASLQQPMVRAHLDVADSGPARQPCSLPPLPPLHRPLLHPLTPSQPLTWPGGWAPATLVQAFSTMGLTPPIHTDWIADSGASFHTTPHVGVLSSVHPLHPSYPSSVMVGDGSCLPFTSVGSASGPFRLSSILVAPKIVHHLLSFSNSPQTTLVLLTLTPLGLL